MVWGPIAAEAAPTLLRLALRQTRKCRSGFSRDNLNRTLAILLLLATLPACTTLPKEVRQELESPAPNQPNNYQLTEAASSEAAPIETAANPACTDTSAMPKPELRDGQIILTESGGPISALMALIPREFHPFSHSGIVAIEDGEPVVYEARGDYKRGGGTPAEDWFKDGSGIRRLTLDQYIAREEYAVVYDPPPGVDGEAVAAFARNEYQAETPFDPYFDHTDTERLYCTEFVDAALRAGGRRDTRLVINRTNSSLQTVLIWWGITINETIPAGRLREGGDYQGELGDQEARRKALVFNAAKRALHARFTPDQRLGSVFAYDGGLRYQPPVRAFIDRAQARFEDACPDVAQRTIDAEIARLAEQVFSSVRRADKPGHVGAASAANRVKRP